MVMRLMRFVAEMVKVTGFGLNQEDIVGEFGFYGIGRRLCFDLFILSNSSFMPLFGKAMGGNGNYRPLMQAPTDPST